MCSRERKKERRKTGRTKGSPAWARGAGREFSPSGDSPVSPTSSSFFLLLASPLLFSFLSRFQLFPPPLSLLRSSYSSSVHPPLLRHHVGKPEASPLHLPVRRRRGGWCVGGTFSSPNPRLVAEWLTADDIQILVMYVTSFRLTSTSATPQLTVETSSGTHWMWSRPECKNLPARIVPDPTRARPRGV